MYDGNFADHLTDASLRIVTDASEVRPVDSIRDLLKAQALEMFSVNTQAELWSDSGSVRIPEHIDRDASKDPHVGRAMLYGRLGRRDSPICRSCGNGRTVPTDFCKPPIHPHLSAYV